MQLNFKKLHKDATTPTYAHAGDAGMDLHTIEETTFAPGERKLMPTGLAMAIPVGYVGLIWDKSGISHKSGLTCLGGVVDAGYRGEIFVGLVNVGDTPYTFAAGDKVAQILIQKVECPELEEVDELDDTSRGAGAFGSTGK